MTEYPIAGGLEDRLPPLADLCLHGNDFQQKGLPGVTQRDTLWLMCERPNGLEILEGPFKGLRGGADPSRHPLGGSGFTTSQMRQDSDMQVSESSQPEGL